MYKKINYFGKKYEKKFAKKGKKLKILGGYNIIFVLEGDRYAVKEIRNTRF